MEPPDPASRPPSLPDPNRGDSTGCRLPPPAVADSGEGGRVPEGLDNAAQVLRGRTPPHNKPSQQAPTRKNERGPSSGHVGKGGRRCRKGSNSRESGTARSGSRQVNLSKGKLVGGMERAEGPLTYGAKLRRLLSSCWLQDARSKHPYTAPQQRTWLEAYLGETKRSPPSWRLHSARDACRAPGSRLVLDNRPSARSEPSTLALLPTGEKRGTATSGRRYPPKKRRKQIQWWRESKRPLSPARGRAPADPRRTFPSSEPAQHRMDRATTRSSLEVWVIGSGSATPGLLVVELEGCLAWRALAIGAPEGTRRWEGGVSCKRGGGANCSKFTSRDRCELARGVHRQELTKVDKESRASYPQRGESALQAHVVAEGMGQQKAETSTATSGRA